MSETMVEKGSAEITSLNTLKTPDPVYIGSG